MAGEDVTGGNITGGGSELTWRGGTGLTTGGGFWIGGIEGDGETSAGGGLSLPRGK